jgi:hypothetical protein
MSNEHHKWEKGIVLLLTLDGWDLEWTGAEFEHYDARGKTPKGFDCVIEFKLRNAYYPTKVLEKYKYDKLMQMDCLKFYYVFDSKGNYLYYLDSLEQPKPNIINCKATTDFERDELINKTVYFLSESQAALINKY